MSEKSPPKDQNITEFLKSETIAVVGVSSSRMKFGSMAYRALKKRGYKVYAVNPSLASFDGDTCYSSLSELPRKAEAVFVAVKPEKVASLVSDAARAGVKRLWLQQGSDFSALAAAAKEVGLETVTDKCLLMYVEPVTGIHRLHRFLARLFERY